MSMQAFIEERFPEDISYGSSGGPRYATSVVETASGFEQRNAKWRQARAVYSINPGLKTAQQVEKLLAFFRARKGKAVGFRFKDWSDYHVRHELLGYGDGLTTTFALYKRYCSGGAEERRRIYKPVRGTVKVYEDHDELSNLSIDYTTGFITFATPPLQGTPIYADCEFDVPVRFDTDQLSVSMENFGVYTTQDIQVVELRICEK